MLKRLFGRSPDTDSPPSASTLSDVMGILPAPFDWVQVPAGSVTLQIAQDPDHPSWGTRPVTIDVPAFVIAKYPVTNAQYEAFVREGYRNSKWWDYSKEATEWRRHRPDPGVTGIEGQDLPRTNVSWYEAVAFCRWLRSRTGLAITLPSDAQWQRAAQGDDQRIYPWGSIFDAEACSSRDSLRKSLTPVGSYPGGGSPFGVMDMAGSVSEWCRTRWADGSNDLTGDQERVVHGGSWLSGREYLECRYRFGSLPFGGSDSLGFRIACDPSPTS